MKKFLSLALVLAALLSASTAAYGKGDKVSVMSFNIRIQIASDTEDRSWDSRKEGCVKAIRKNMPDVLGVQEATYTQRVYLVNELSKYQVVGMGSAGTLDPELDHDFNPIFYRTDRFDLLDYGSFWLNEDQTPNKKGWDAEYVRNVTWVKLSVRKSGQIFFFFNTHFDNVGATARYQSSLLLADKIREIAGNSAVVMLGGDFNVPIGASELKPLEDYLEVAQTSVKKQPKVMSYNAFSESDTHDEAIDHIFFRNAEIQSFSIDDGRYSIRILGSKKYGVQLISDHFPVCADFVVGTDIDDSSDEQTEATAPSAGFLRGVRLFGRNKN